MFLRELLTNYSLMHKKTDKTKFKNCIGEKFMEQHNSFTCISPDYVFHESPKEFWKNSHFENMRASFLLKCENSLRFLPLKKNILANIMS